MTVSKEERVIHTGNPRPAATGTETAPPTGARPSPLPSGGDILFLAVLYLVLIWSPNRILGDASVGWHLVTGEYIVDHLRVPQRDLISYTFPNKPWVPYEWLFDVAAAVLVRMGGLALLAVIAASAIALLFALLYKAARQTGCQFQSALTVTLIGALASSIHWLARPHLFTFFGVYIFAGYLEALHRNRTSALAAGAALGGTMVLWANAHPAFIIGIAMVLIYLVAEAVTAATSAPGEERGGAIARSKAFAGVLAISAATSVINPAGMSLYPYITALLREAPVLNGFEEWMSPVFHGQLYGICLELLFAAFVVGLVASRRRLWLGQLLLVLAFGYLALSAVRNVPLFAIVAVPVVAELAVQVDVGALLGLDRDARAGWVAAVAGRWRPLAETFDIVERRCSMHLIPIVTVVVLALSCVAAAHIRGAHALVSSRFDPRRVPTATLTYITRARLRWDRGFALDNWGGYIRYETGQRVFIDDRLDFYGQAFDQRYVQTIAARPGWNKLLDEYGIQWVLVPRDVPLTVMLEQTAGWRLAAQDGAAYLFVRNPRR